MGSAFGTRGGPRGSRRLGASDHEPPLYLGGEPPLYLGQNPRLPTPCPPYPRGQEKKGTDLSTGAPFRSFEERGQQDSNPHLWWFSPVSFRLDDTLDGTYQNRPQKSKYF